AREPLAATTAYTVNVTASVNGKAWKKTWRFKTSGGKTNKPGRRETALDQVNAYRKIVHLEPVALDARLSRGCLRHAEYLVKNAGHPSLQGLGMHNEDPHLPGYTDEGALAGKSSVIYNGPVPADTVDTWMNSFFHRIPLLDPDLKRIGYGQAKGGPAGYVAVMDVHNGKGFDHPVIFPGDGQQQVRLAYQPGELPDPIPESK